MTLDAPGVWLTDNAAAAAGDNTLFIGFAGFKADGASAKNWVKAVGRAKGYAHIAAVSGPARVMYQDHEKKAALALFISTMAASLRPGRIIIAAHSSGSFVADEFLAMLAKSAPAMLDVTTYYDLDGAPCAACPAASAAALGFNFTCVAMARGSLRSPNYDAMLSCGQKRSLVLSGAGGCVGTWCLHACLVNRRAAALDAQAPMAPAYYGDPAMEVNTDYLR